MPFSLLRIDNFRNISSAEVCLSEDLNYFVGANGSGKTSFLEAIYSLVRGRSFRTRYSKPMIMDGSVDNTVVFANWAASDGTLHFIGVERNLKASRVRLDGQDVRRISTVSSLIPLQFLSSQSASFFTSGPSARRKYFDWGVFHVEQQFIHTWDRYKRLIQQRNVALRNHDKQTISAFQYGLANAALDIDEYRKNYFEAISSVVTSLCNEFSIFPGLSLVYERGWNEGIQFEQALKSKLPSDLSRGYTSIGPQYFDVRFLICRQPVEQVLSGGELKLLVHLLKVAQICLLNNIQTISTVYLIDDFYAELSPLFRVMAQDLLKYISSQVLITSPDICLIPLSDSCAKTFHVEHGKITSVN